MPGALRQGARLVLLGVAVLPAMTATAAPSIAEVLELFSATSESSSMSLNEAASRAQDRYGGEVLSVEPAERGDTQGWRVKVLLDDGRVKTLFVDERSGDVRDRRNLRWK